MFGRRRDPPINGSEAVFYGILQWLPVTYRHVNGHETKVARGHYRTHRDHGPRVRVFAGCRHAELPTCDFLNRFVCAWVGVWKARHGAIARRTRLGVVASITADLIILSSRFLRFCLVFRSYAGEEEVRS